MRLHQTVQVASPDAEVGFDWQDHHMLHLFMSKVALNAAGRRIIGPSLLVVHLAVEDIQELRERLETGQLQTNGHVDDKWQRQIASKYRETDLAFCDTAENLLNAGATLIYVANTEGPKQ